MKILTYPETDYTGTRDGDSRRLESAILNLVMGTRRALPGDPCIRGACADCFMPHLGKVESFIAKSLPIHFVLPAFPAKSPNPRNVLGTLPDMAERLALDFLQQLCERIGEVYAPGARITICSDGRVFSDLVRLQDQDVSTYTGAIRQMIEEQQAHALDVFDLDEAFASDDFDVLRGELDRRHATPLEAIRSRVKNEAAPLHAFNGIARFLFEDRVVLDAHRSRTALRNECKDLAYRVIQRSMAWSDLIQERFAESVRLSIHPQSCHSKKIGIYLIGTLDNWLTPWHGVAVETPEGFTLMKRHQAEEAGADLVYRDGRPSHFFSHRSLEAKPCYAQAS